MAAWQATDQVGDAFVAQDGRDGVHGHGVRPEGLQRDAQAGQLVGHRERAVVVGGLEPDGLGNQQALALDAPFGALALQA